MYTKLLSQFCFVFFPGESNEDLNRDLYSCMFPALIDDWRQTFHDGSQKQTERFFPFGFVQVCVQRKAVYGHVCGAWKVCAMQISVQELVFPLLFSRCTITPSCI